MSLYFWREKNSPTICKLFRIASKWIILEAEMCFISVLFAIFQAVISTHELEEL